MKKVLIPLLTAFLVIVLAACAASTTAKTSSFQATSAPTIVHFADPVLEEMVRGAIGKPEGDITSAEAEAVTRLNLSNELGRYISTGTTIKDISGLESFTNLETLDLSFHEISDISPLKGLNKLTSLSLGGNPIADITPLGGLTNLKALSFSNCEANDYSPLAKLVDLEFLKLDNSTINDLSPLGSLTNLKYLYLADSPANDYSPLAEIYPNLVKKDFVVASTLKELGFSMNGESNQAYFSADNTSFTINHTRWGAPPAEWDANIIRMSTDLESSYKLEVGFYGDIDAYVFQMFKDDEMIMNYVYDAANNNLSVGPEDRVNFEQLIRAAFDVLEGEDALLAPIRIFDDTLQKTFNMTANALYALPFEAPTLENLGFSPDEDNAVWRYEQREGSDVNIEIHNPEWGEKDYDFLFFMSLSDEYRMVMTYHSNKRSFVIGIDDNDQGGADYEYFIDTHEHIDGGCSNEGTTVEEYFINVFNDPEIKDIYPHPVELMEQYINDTFGMSFEELYALPSGEE